MTSGAYRCPRLRSHSPGALQGQVQPLPGEDVLFEMEGSLVPN